MTDQRYTTPGEPAMAAQALEPPPFERAAWGWVLMALSFLTMQTLLTGMVRGINVIGVLVAGVALVRMAPQSSFLMILRWLPVMSVPIMAALSAIWSEAPGESFRIGMMTVVTVMIAVLMADRLRSWKFISALHVALMLVVGTSLITFQPPYPLAGFTGNKNVLGFYAMAAVLTSLALTFDSHQPLRMRWFGMACAPYSFLILLLSKSAGSFVACLVGMGVFGALLTLRALSGQTRIVLLVAVFVIATPLIVARPLVVEAAHDFQENVLKKDRTLTGRTYLWERADAVIQQRPILGHGYAAFWRQGSLDAEGLWRYAGIEARMGFNFHNDYVDTAVALGKTGVFLFVLTMLLLSVPGIIRSFLSPSAPVAFFSAFSMAVFIRTSAESGMISAWSVSTMVIFVGGVYGLRGDVAPFLVPPGRLRALGRQARSARLRAAPAE